MVKRKTIKVSRKNGVTVLKNKFVDVTREYDVKSGKKKQAILEQYSMAQQINVLRKAVIKIAESSNVEINELKEMDAVINSLEA